MKKKKLDENKIVGNFFNIPITKKQLNEFANMPKSAAVDDETVIDRPSDVTDISSARNEILRIMKLAGQSGSQNKPVGWNLVLYNDNITPGQAVIEGLSSVMGMNRAAISKVIHDCATKGHAVLGTYAIEDKALKLRDALKRAIDTNREYEGGDVTYGPWNVRIEVLKAGE
jgi:ATP-dependent Clp protease adapter protein ClpS